MGNSPRRYVPSGRGRRTSESTLRERAARLTVRVKQEHKPATQNMPQCHQTGDEDTSAASADDARS